jgi:hypothetical protein
MLQASPLDFLFPVVNPCSSARVKPAFSFLPAIPVVFFASCFGSVAGLAPCCDLIGFGCSSTRVQFYVHEVFV